MALPYFAEGLDRLVGKTPSHLVEGLDTANAVLTVAHSCDNFVVGVIATILAYLAQRRFSRVPAPAKAPDGTEKPQ